MFSFFLFLTPSQLPTVDTEHKELEHNQHSITTMCFQVDVIQANLPELNFKLTITH